jgi:plastocyanin
MNALAITLLAAAFLAGCSSAPAGPTVLKPDAQGHYVIHMLTSNQFSPKDAQVPVGANVTWTNDGGAQHNVVAMDGSFTSDDDVGHPIGPGQSYSRVFDKAGTYTYHCAFHSGMEAKLTVA